MGNEINYITAEKKKLLEAELEELRGPKRKEVLEALKTAKALGDLSENAEYHQAREDQGRLEFRISQIEDILRSAEVVAGESTGDKITFGSRVSLRREGEGADRNYTIVGTEEVDMASGKLSHTSPIGKAVFGKMAGESVMVDTPSGKINYKIVAIA